MDSTEKRQQNKRLFFEIVRFLLAGGLATVCDYATYLLFRKVVLPPELMAQSVAWDAGSAVIATTFGFLVGLIVSWILSVLFVFRDGENTVRVKDKKHFAVFTLIAIIGLVFTEVAVGIGVLVVPSFSLFGSENFLSLGWNEWLVKLVTTWIVLVFNYFARKRFIFNR
ncbi:MAG: GtrA family protein [Clostridiales bacterium]|nr:GtrA family protein [Clostridiales bacterium]